MQQSAFPAASKPAIANFESAFACHQAGELAEAARQYEAVLRADPVHFHAMHLLGVTQLQRGDSAAAEKTIAAALMLSPLRASALGNHGLTLHNLGRFNEALRRFDQALAVKPDFADALSNRGRTLQMLGRFNEALASFDGALAVDAGHVPALKHRADTLRHLRRFDEALAGYDLALLHGSPQIDVLNSRGKVLQELERLDDALDSYDRVLAIDPGQAGVLINRGNMLFRLGRLDEALDAFDRALAIDPAQAGALNNRGLTLMTMQTRFDEALASFDRALAIDPRHADALNNRSQLLMRNKEYAKAKADVDALLLRPDFPYALGNALTCQLHACDWRDLERRIEQVSSGIGDGRKVISPSQFLAVADDAALQRSCAQIGAADKYPARPAMVHSQRGVANRKLRIGYLSADFHNHATAALASQLFEQHDRNDFEVIGISFGPDDRSAERKRLRGAFDRFIDVSRESDRQVAARVNAMQIDIAVDLKGYTQDGRPGIFAWRPAPLQVNYLGYPGTMGAEFIDYLIADRTVVPSGYERFYTESIVRLPDSYQPNDATRAIADRTPTRRECGLPGRGFVFCCFNNNYKITPAMFDVWMRILRRVDGSVLWLFEDNPTAPANLRREAASRGVDPQRLIFAARAAQSAHLARHRLADLSLDTLPINAHTTASDALWAGLPLLTCAGESFAARVAASLLNAAQLPELVTHNLSDYEEAAVRLASTSGELTTLRTRLQRTRLQLPLFDAPRYARHLEDAYRLMWERHCRGEEPRTFDVAGAVSKRCPDYRRVAGYDTCES
jgi:predicted O-linked N-acetylglucosamine transferase (SPINDLY family)